LTVVGAVVGGGGRTAQTNLSGARVQDKPQALDTFLESVERRAFRLARYATRNDDDALDVVQEAMMRCSATTQTPAHKSGRCCFSAYCKTEFGIGSAGKLCAADGNSLACCAAVFSLWPCVRLWLWWPQARRRRSPSRLTN
tara:strand:+ start:945 stop:1367 length:423 start_codon:yes stop_codon:yes gene_type:complete